MSAAGGRLKRKREEEEVEEEEVWIELESVQGLESQSEPEEGYNECKYFEEADSEFDDDEHGLNYEEDKSISLLKDAIAMASEPLLRRILHLVCRDSRARAMAIDGFRNTPPGCYKRLKRNSYETCKRCDEEYHVVQNLEWDDMCQYHDGEKEVNYDNGWWVDEDAGDVEESPEDLRFDPDEQGGFRWTCCGRRGDGKGCYRARHEPRDKVWR